MPDKTGAIVYRREYGKHRESEALLNGLPPDINESGCLRSSHTLLAVSVFRRMPDFIHVLPNDPCFLFQGYSPLTDIASATLFIAIVIAAVRMLIFFS